MFYLLNLEKELEIQPRFFGPRLHKEIEERLRQEVRGVMGRDGRRQGRVQRWSSLAASPAPLRLPLRPPLSSGAPPPARVQVEGTCDGQHGFILGVLKMLELGKGLVREGTGSALFNCSYQCLAFAPFKGEVLDVLVTSVNKVRAGRRAPLSGGRRQVAASGAR